MISNLGILFKDSGFFHPTRKSNMTFLLQVTFVVVMKLSGIFAFSSGPPLSTCESMFAFHRIRGVVPRTYNEAQTGPSPYNISVSNSSYTAGENLTVTISGTISFNGFILQAQGINSSVAWPVGEFVQIPSGAQHLYCSGGEPKNTVGHNNTRYNKTEWNSRQFTWMAPAKNAGNITFIATIVHNYSTFWTKLASSVVAGPPAENVTRGATTESFQIDKTGCGKTKGCYSLPSSCTGSADCNYLFTYQVSGGSVTIEMSAKERWVSVAFNDKKLMDKMDSIWCVTMATNLAELRYYYSHGHHVDRQNLAGNSDIILRKIVYEDGGIKCKLTRKLISSAAYFRDLTKKWYLLFSHGPTSISGSTQYHSTNRTFTGVMVNLSAPAILFHEETKKTIDKDGCGETKSCYSEPENCKSSSDCQYLVTMKPVGDEDSDDGEVEFELSAKGQWVAIGFNSEKNKMPGTDTLICAKAGHGSRVSVERYFVEGYDTPAKTSPRPTSLVLDFGESSGGVLSCRFRRKKKDDKMVDLTESWYLVYASGPMNGHAIGKHSTTPKTSPEKVKVDDIGKLGAEKEGPEMIQAHGCLMVIAWVGFASIGIFMARYMKVAFGEKVLFGTKVWFTFHRSLLILTVLFTIVSTIIIFVHAGRWTKEAGAHPITGIIVLVLAVIQPIMALFRPHPGEAKRFIFNWAHRGVGMSSLILAVVTVFLGIRLPDSNLDDSAMYVMIVYCLGVAIVIVFELYLILKKERMEKRFSPPEGDVDAGEALVLKKPDGMETHFSSSEGDEDAGGHILLKPSGDQFLFARQLMLGFLVALVSGVVIALVVLIAIADEEGGHEHEH